MPPGRPERAAALAATQHGLITAAQCREVGLSRDSVHRLVTRGAWMPVAPRVYRVVGARPTWEARTLAAVLSAGPGAVASHRTAAYLWGLDGFGPPGRLDVTVPRNRRPVPRRGVILHESLVHDLAASVVRHGIPTTGAARTVFDLAAVSPEDEALRALDEVRRRRLASWSELREVLVLHAARGRRGSARFRAVLELREGRRVPDTEIARRVMRLLRDAGLPEPVAEHTVVARGRRHRVDLAYPVRRLAIELDGKEVHLNDAAFESDRARDIDLRLAGWTVLRFTWRRLVADAPGIVADVRFALGRAAGAPNAP